jgi:hypothetical protein
MSSQRIKLLIMLALLRGPGRSEMRAEVGEPTLDGAVFVRLLEGGTFIPYQDTLQTTEDGLPIFEYAM